MGRCRVDKCLSDSGIKVFTNSGSRQSGPCTCWSASSMRRSAKPRRLKLWTCTRADHTSPSRVRLSGPSTGSISMSLSNGRQRKTAARSPSRVAVSTGLAPVVPDTDYAQVNAWSIDRS
jgi:hypothetical protein